jgi:AcrR family transcriptional regulator
VLSFVWHDGPHKVRQKAGAAVTSRADARSRTTAAILAAARAEVAERGGGGLSMRSVARSVGLVSSAVYRYFPSREALLTAMIIEGYGHLEEALDAVPGARPDRRWVALAETLRAWARASPLEYQLIYGTPIPGYAAPSETIAAAAAVVRPFVETAARSPVAGFADPVLAGQMTAVRDLVPGADPTGAAAVLAELAALIGFVSLELAGHFVGTADPADPLYAALLERQVATLGLRPG